MSYTFLSFFSHTYIITQVGAEQVDYFLTEEEQWDTAVCVSLFLCLSVSLSHTQGGRIRSSMANSHQERCLFCSLSSFRLLSPSKGYVWELWLWSILVSLLIFFSFYSCSSCFSLSHTHTMHRKPHGAMFGRGSDEEGLFCSFSLFSFFLLCLPISRSISFIYTDHSVLSKKKSGVVGWWGMFFCSFLLFSSFSFSFSPCVCGAGVPSQ